MGRNPRRLRLGLKSEPIEDGLRITDRFDLVDTIELVGGSATVLQGVLAGEPYPATARLAQEATGETFTPAEVKGLIGELAALGLFTDRATTAQLAAELDRHLIDDTLVVPGFSPATALRRQARLAIAEARQAMLDAWGPPPPLTRLQGALSPHGSLATTGRCAAHAYALLTPETWPEVFVIAGTAHYSRQLAILTHRLMTPLGKIESDPRLVEALLAIKGLRFVKNEPSFLIEHSWRQDLALLQVLAEEFGKVLRVVPLLCGGMTSRHGVRLGRGLRHIAFHARKRVCFIASGDLSHYGKDYRWKPSWLSDATETAAVLDRIAAIEAPILQTICDRDQARFDAAVDTTSFCARPQVNALMEFATVKGVRLNHQSVVNWVPVTERPSTPWTPNDLLFNAASIAFAVGGPGRTSTPEATAIRLCPSTFISLGRELHLLHACDNTAYIFPAFTHPIFVGLLDGVATMAQLHARLTELDIEPGVLAAFVDDLRDGGLLHAYEPPSLTPSKFSLARAANTLAWARQKVPYYRETLRSNDLTAAPSITSATIQQRWQDFSREDAAAVVGDQELYKRRSSSSSGAAGLQTVESKAVVDENSSALALVGKAAGKVASINRPSNLMLEATATRPGFSEVGFKATPGPNPSLVTPEVWDQIIARLITYAPDTLEGEPSYIATLARRCRALGVTIPGLKRVQLGHSYPWQLYREAIASAFAVPVVRTYHCSEVGVIAITCGLGAYHLVEPHFVYEALTRGKWCRAGELGAMVLTTLDAQLRPLIRYALGDVVRFTAASCACGRPGRVMEYEGRIRHLFQGRQGAPVTYVDIDRAIGAPQGLAYFQLEVDKDAAVLTAVAAGDRGLVDAAAVVDRVAELIARPVKLSWKSHLELASPAGKLLSLATRVDESAAWYKKFLER